MKYFLDTEFIEGFNKPMFGKKRHFIDLISIGIYREDGKSLYLISNEYNYDDASQWVKENVIAPMYVKSVSGDVRNGLSSYNFHKHTGLSNSAIRLAILEFFGCWRDVHFWRAPEGIEVYGYYADYDWVLFCSLFGRMIDLPKGFPMYCRDLKQTFDNYAMSFGWSERIGLDEMIKKLKENIDYPKQTNEHNALADAKWNYGLYKFLST